jgi:hypothetical protein
VATKMSGTCGLKPCAVCARLVRWVFENVRGLLRPKFADHLNWVRLSLTEPDLVQDAVEDTADQLDRLRAKEPDGTYRVSWLG